MTLEMGKPIAESKAEIAYAAEFFRWFAEEAVRIEGRYATAPNGAGRLLTHAPAGRPLPLITPWNFPMAMGTRKIGPAIAAGCTMVDQAGQADAAVDARAGARSSRRPGCPAACSTSSPRSPRRRSEPLIGDPRLRKLSFTGSTEVGRKLIEQAAARASCACRWSSAATRRSSSSTTPTSTPRSRAR